MYPLFLRALQRLLQTHLSMPADPTLLVKNIASTYHFDITYSKLARLPLSELKNALKVPCPIVGNYPEDKQIALFKRIRNNMTVDEASVCLKCDRKCAFRGLAFKDMPVKPQTSNKSALNDVLFFLTSLSHQPQNAFSSLRWASAYKVALALDPFMRDLVTLGKEAFLFREVLKHEESQENAKKQKGKKGERALQEARKMLASRKIVLE